MTNGFGRAGLALVLGVFVGCGTSSEIVSEKPVEPTSPLAPPSGESRLLIHPGECIGPVCLGATYAELVSELGELEGAMGYRRIILGRYADLGVEVSLASPDEFVASPDALVVALGTLEGTSFDGLIRPGMSAAELASAIGETPTEIAGKYIFLPTGISVLTGDNGKVERVGIYSPYEIRREPPPMDHASSTASLGAE